MGLLGRNPGMPHNPLTTESRLDEAVARLKAGDKSAIDDLLGHVRNRLMMITRRKLRGPGGFTTVAGLYATDDVVQEASLRLEKTLRNTPVNSGDHFLRLAAVHIKQTLLNLHAHARTKSRFPGTVGASQAGADDPAALLAGAPARTDAEFRWDKFLDHFKSLTDEQRQMLDDVFFNGCTQQETADRMRIGITAFKDRWLKLKLLLIDQGFTPFN